MYLKVLHLGSGDFHLSLSLGDATWISYLTLNKLLIADLHYSELKGFRGNLVVYPI